MNILFIGPYRQYDSWGQASKDYIRALLTTKHNVAVRPIYLSKTISTEVLDDNIQQAEETFLDETDIVIQHALPAYFRNIPTVKHNIGLSFFETNALEQTGWHRNINFMDSMWVSSKYEQDTLLQHGVKTNVDVIHAPMDISKYSIVLPKPKLPDIFINKYDIKQNTFKFYFIGEYIHRKNIIELIFAFMREFNHRENVELIIKTGHYGMPPHVLQNKIYQEIAQLQKSMRLYNTDRLYNTPVVITDRLSNDDMDSLHKSCDCFVTASYGEAFCRPAMDAMGFGNTPICTSNTGMTEFINNDTGWLVPSILSPVLTSTPPMPNIYTSWELWSQPDILMLQKMMREAYEFSSGGRNNKRQHGMEMVQHFSYKSVGEQINATLEGLI